MIYMYVLDSSVLQQGVSDALFEKQWEIYQSRVNGHSVGPVPYKTVSHHWEEISALSVVESIEQAEPIVADVEFDSAIACSSEPVVEAADIGTEAFIAELASNDQPLPFDESAVAIESPVEVQDQEENALADNTVAYDDDIGAGGMDEVSESLAEAKGEEALEKERYLLNNCGYIHRCR